MTTTQTDTDGDNIAPTSYVAGQTAFGKDIIIERANQFGWRVRLLDGPNPKMFEGIFTRLEDAQWIAHKYQYERVYRYKTAVDEEARKENKRRAKSSSN